MPANYLDDATVPLKAARTAASPMTCKRLADFATEVFDPEGEAGKAPLIPHAGGNKCLDHALQKVPFVCSYAAGSTRTLRGSIRSAVASEAPSGTYEKTGAAEESRTLDLNLGKVALYQLSYCRDEPKL
jgi:hypothetical protein